MVGDRLELEQQHQVGIAAAVSRMRQIMSPSQALMELTRNAPGVDVAEEQFRDCVRSLSDRGDWCSLGRTDAAKLITLAQASDLVVIGQVNARADPVPAWYRPEEIVINCGRPVLMVPYIRKFPRIGQRVLIAWDGSREAVRHQPPGIYTKRP
jgi:hypothetical protein